MKNKLILLLLATSLTLSACSSKPTNTDTTHTDASQESINEEIAIDDSTTEENITEDVPTEEVEQVDIADIGEIEVDENLFTVELTIPADIIGETTQEDLTAAAEEAGYKSITLNEDGSATYVMTKKQHEELLAGVVDSMNENLNALVGSESLPNVTSIEANDNFSEFKITTKSTELDISESFSVLGFYMYGGMYAAFSGEEIDNVSVTFINAESGEIISTANSADAGE